MWLSVAAAIATILLKAAAAYITGSVGFLSDAMESGVNLVAAIVALIALKVSTKPADENHHFGHGKAEYLSALVEGLMIFIAATSIIWAAVGRLMNPRLIEQPGIGLVLSSVASVINLAVGMLLIRKGRQYRSVTLVADGKHLLTDVWTSVGVLVGIGLVWLTKWPPLDPIIALLVGVNILWTGYGLLKRSMIGLLSAAIPPEEEAQIEAILEEFSAVGVTFLPLRTIEAGRQRQVFVIIQVPPDWTVGYTHDICDEIEERIEATLPRTETFIHAEPLST
jgi:cation diffusion facilitator family transporter